jgi:hypothetical protein
MILKRATEVEDNIAKGAALKVDDFTPEVSGWMDFIISVRSADFGAQMVKKFGLAGAGVSLIAASRAAKLGRDLFQKAPFGRVKALLQEASMPGNGKLLAAIMRKGASKVEAKENLTIIRQALLIEGPIDWMDEDKEDNVMIRNKDKNFVKRALNPDSSPKITNDDGSKSTHRMASGETDGRFIAYPTITQDKDGSLRQREDNDAFRYAMETGEFIEFDTDQEAKRFASGEYKKLSGWKPDR